MRLYLLIARFRFAVYRQYPFEFAAAFIKPLINLGFLTLFWSIVASSSAGKIQLQSIMAYLLVATAISNLTLVDLRVGSALAKAIKSGGVSYSLIRPIYAPLYYLSNSVGTIGATYIVSLVIFCLGIALRPPTSAVSVLLFLLYLPIACAISYSLNVIVGTLAFYFTEAGSIKNVMGHIISVFSGALVPLTFFPAAAQAVVLGLPFSAAVFGPTHALRVTSLTSQDVMLLLVGVAWAILLLFVAKRFWRKGVQQYEAIGI